MGQSVAQAWIEFFFLGSNFIALLAAVVGFIGAWVCLVKIKDFLGRETRQHAKASSVFAWFLVAGIGLSFASFVERSNQTLYQGTGAQFQNGQNPITWRAENAPSLGGMEVELVLTAVILIGFGFLGAVSFFLALLTMMRFDTMHPQHHGSFKDFFMYVFGGVVSTNIAGVFAAMSSLIPVLSSTAEMLRRAQESINFV